MVCGNRRDGEVYRGIRVESESEREGEGVWERDRKRE
jgi:hypothetical protein